MAVSVTRVLDTVEGAHRITISDVTLDSSYPTGGESLTAAQLGFGVYVTNAVCNLKSAGSTTVNIAEFHYDTTNEKLQVFDETPGQVADTADLTGVVVRVQARGH